MKLPVSVHRGKQVTRFLKLLLRYAFPNVDYYNPLANKGESQH